jgi:hypothetical protein
MNKEGFSMPTASQRATALAFVLAASAAATAFAQETADNPDGPEAMDTETMPEQAPGRALREAQDALTDLEGMVGDMVDQEMTDPGAMDQGMMDSPMDHGTMSQGMMCSEMCAGMMGRGGMDQGQRGGRMHSGNSDPGLVDRRRDGDRADSQMPPGRMGSTPEMGRHGHAMRLVFAIADADGDGGLSLEETADIQARIFSAIDADDDGTMTPEELQAFMGE